MYMGVCTDRVRIESPFRKLWKKKHDYIKELEGLYKTLKFGLWHMCLRGFIIHTNI